MDIIDRLYWRYAVKKFNPGRKLEKEQKKTLLEAVRLSASSFGLQPYRLILVENQDLRRSLIDASMGQEKVYYASDLVVFAIKKEFTDSDVDAYLDLIAREREQPRSELDGMEKMLKGFIARKSVEEYRAWAARQAYIALGNLLTVCAALSIDACPMEGFKPAEYDRILELEKLGLRTAVIATLGVRAEDDSYAVQKKVRMPMQEFLITK